MNWHKVVVLRLPVAGNELELVPLVVLDPYPHISANWAFVANEHKIEGKTCSFLISPDKRHDHKEAVPVPDVEAVWLDGILLGEREVVDGVPLPVAYLVLGFGAEHRVGVGYTRRKVQSDGLIIGWFKLQELRRGLTLGLTQF